MPAVPSAIALHIEAAKRLLQELDEQASSAMQAVGQTSPADLFETLAQRDQTLEQLGGVVNAIASRTSVGELDGSTRAALQELGQAAAAALESQGRLAAVAQRERNRLADAQDRAARPDGIARQYGAATRAAHPRLISVSG